MHTTFRIRMKGRLPGEVDADGVVTPTIEEEVARLDGVLNDGTLRALLIEYGVLPQVCSPPLLPA